MSRKLGNIAEDIAYEYICDLGYQIIERNFTLQGGEIDIIAVKDEVLHFIEVKSGYLMNICVCYSLAEQNLVYPGKPWINIHHVTSFFSTF
jgi:hypothetical protein